MVERQLRVWVLAVEGNNTWQVRSAEDKTPEAAGTDTAGKVVRGLQLRVSAGEGYHAGLGARDVANAGIATDLVDTWQAVSASVLAGGKVVAAAVVEG